MNAIKTVLSKKAYSKNDPVTLVLCSFLATVFLSRLIGFLVIRSDLPRGLFVNIQGYRLHHFVYGNFILLALGFIRFVLDINVPKRVGALIFGVGLGLVIDEFALWSGAITYLSAGSLQVFNGINICAVTAVALILLYFVYKNNAD